MQIYDTYQPRYSAALFDGGGSCTVAALPIKRCGMLRAC